jgi:hypothetical protein
MDRLSKHLIFYLVVILAVSSLLMIKPIDAQTIPKPAVPQFSVAVVDHSYVAQASTSIDPYTGKEITHPSYTVENKTIDITIKNQPFMPPNELTDLLFSIRLKGHFENTWRELYHITNKTNDNALLRQSHTVYTVLSIPQSFPANGSVDFQVKAFIAVGIIDIGSFGHWTWQESLWSPTQTIVITDNAFSSSITSSPYPSLSPISTPTPSPTVPEFPLTSTLIAVLVAVTLLLVIGKGKRNFSY